MIDFATLNYPAIVVAALAAFFIGFMWHGPVFGKQWMKLMAITPEEMEKGQKEMQGNMWKYLLAAFIQQLIIATVTSIFATALGVHDPIAAIVLAVWLWLGYIAAVLLNGVLWEKRSVPLYLFNITYHLVSVIVITLIVGLWR